MVEFIEYNGEKYPVRVSYYALKYVSAEKDVSLADLLAADITILEPLLYRSLIAGARAEGSKTIPFKEDDMEFVLDECMTQFLDVIPKFFPEGTGGKLTAEQELLLKQVQTKQTKTK